MNAKIREAYDRVHKAEKELAQDVRSEFPIGTIARYEVRDSIAYVEVLDHYGDRVFVRGYSSGKEYSIYAYRLS